MRTGDLYLEIILLMLFKTRKTYENVQLNVNVFHVYFSNRPLGSSLLHGYLLLFSPATRCHGQGRMPPYCFSQKTRNSVTGNLSTHSFKCSVLTIMSVDLVDVE